MNLISNVTTLLLDGIVFASYTTIMCYDVKYVMMMSAHHAKIIDSLYLIYIPSFCHYTHTISCVFAGMTPCTSSPQLSLRNSLQTTWGRVTSSTSSSPSLTITSREWRCRRQPLKISMTQMWWVLTTKIKDYFFLGHGPTTDTDSKDNSPHVYYSSAVFDGVYIATQAWFSWVPHNMITQWAAFTHSSFLRTDG